MERRHIRTPPGERCRLMVPYGHDKTTTVTTALRVSGPFAVHLMNDVTNEARFLSYVIDAPVLALRSGVTVVMDNLSAHKVKGMREVIEAAGTPPSPSRLQSRFQP